MPRSSQALASQQPVDQWFVCGNGKRNGIVDAGHVLLHSGASAITLDLDDVVPQQLGGGPHFSRGAQPHVCVEGRTVFTGAEHTWAPGAPVLSREIRL